MRYSTIVASLVTLAAPSVFAGNYSNVTEVYDTVTAYEVVTEFTTYCPEPTTLTYGTKTITVTGATTLTITDCPCTIPVTSPTPEVTAPALIAPALTPEGTTTSTVCPPEGCDSTITVPIKVTVTNSRTMSGNGTAMIAEATGAADKLIPAGAFAGAVAFAFLF